jgi:hypothetical protein
LSTTDEENGDDSTTEKKNIEETSNENGKGNSIRFKIIARDEFQSDKAVTRAYILDILGKKKSRMDEEKLRLYVATTSALKKSVMEYMRIYINRKWTLIAENDVNLKNTIPLLQKQWADMNLDDKPEVLRTCQSFWKLIQPGATEEFNSDWEYKAQDEYMKRHHYKYGTEDDTQGNNKGCIAMTARAVLRASRKKLFFKAMNGGHGYFLSPTIQGVKGIVSKTVTRKKDNRFRSKYLRQSKSNITGKVKPIVRKDKFVFSGDGLDDSDSGPSDEIQVAKGSRITERKKKESNHDKVRNHQLV